MKVLVYTRPRTEGFLKALAERIDLFDEIVYFSDSPGLVRGSDALMARFYRFKNGIENGTHADWPLWDSLDEADIHDRCRYLRQLSLRDAALRIRAMASAFDEMIREHRPDLIFGLVMDSYVQDVAHRLMAARGGAYAGILNNMVNGYSRLTAYGEFLTTRTVEDAEIEAAIRQLSDRAYVPSMQKDFMWSTHPARMFFTSYLHHKGKLGYYWGTRTLGRDPDNFYANTVAHDSCMSCHGVDQLFYRRFQQDDWRQQVEAARAAGKMIVYLPLQFYPECSLDYWIHKPQMRHFYEIMNRICALDPKDCIILAKEHPSASAMRKSAFYRQLSDARHIALVPFDEPSNGVIAEADLVLTWTGSVGIEAVVRGKPLVSLGGTYFDPGDAFVTLETYEDVTNLEAFIAKAMARHKETDADALRHSVIAYLLSGLIRGYVFPLDYGTDKNPDNEERISELAGSISRALETRWPRS